MAGSFEILSLDLEKKRIGVALVAEGSARTEEVTESQDATAEAPESFGSLADKLRGALQSRQKR
jgi:RNase H-fold protein (predicted Holliday junction resolvase)